jgi:hypothetical protein
MTVSLVWDATKEYKTPDAQIAARLIREIDNLEKAWDDPAAQRLIEDWVIECVGRHVVSNCFNCSKFGECEIHNLDIDVVMNGKAAEARAR